MILRRKAGGKRFVEIQSDHVCHLSETAVFQKAAHYLWIDPPGVEVACSFSGKAKLNVYDDSHWIQPQELIILLPGQFVSFTEASDDFLTTTLVVSPTMFSDALSGVPRFSPHFFFYMRTHYWYPQTENDTRRLMNFFGMVKDKVTSNDIYRRELIIHLLRYLYLELFNAYEKEASLMTTRKDTRKEELANKFFGLIMKHFKENKDVAFYADKLCITSKYLTMVIKEVSGTSSNGSHTKSMIRFRL